MHRTLHTLLLVAGVLPRAIIGAQATHGIVALRFGQLVDGTGRTLRDAVVVIDGERIQSVGTGRTAIPRGAVVRDLRRYTGIPGLIDAHTHMTYYWDGAAGRIRGSSRDRATRGSRCSSRRRTHCARSRRA